MEASIAIAIGLLIATVYHALDSEGMRRKVYRMRHWNGLSPEAREPQVLGSDSLVSDGETKNDRLN